MGCVEEGTGQGGNSTPGQSCLLCLARGGPGLSQISAPNGRPGDGPRGRVMGSGALPPPPALRVLQSYKNAFNDQTLCLMSGVLQLDPLPGGSQR